LDSNRVQDNFFLAHAREYARPSKNEASWKDQREQLISSGRTMAKIAEIALNYRQKKPEEKTSQAPNNTL